MLDPNLIDARTEENLDWWRHICHVNRQLRQIRLGSLVCHGLVKNRRHLPRIEDESYQVRGWVLGTSCFRGRRRRCHVVAETGQIGCQAEPLPQGSLLAVVAASGAAIVLLFKGSAAETYGVYVRIFGMIFSLARAARSTRVSAQEDGTVQREAGCRVRLGARALAVVS